MTNTQTYAMMISRLHQLKWGRVRGCDLSQVSKNWLTVADFVAHRMKFDVVNWIFLRIRYRWKTTRFPSIMFYLCFKKDFRTLCFNVVNLAIRESVKVKSVLPRPFGKAKYDYFLEGWYSFSYRSFQFTYSTHWSLGSFSPFWTEYYFRLLRLYPNT